MKISNNLKTFLNTNIYPKTALCKLIEAGHDLGQDEWLHALVLLGLRLNQDALIFQPYPPGIAAIKDPDEYMELRGTGTVEKRLRTADGATISIWERKAEPHKPHFIIYHGQMGHWGDAGSPDYDRRAYLKILSEIEKTGSGFTAVHLRGYGNSIGKPKELYNSSAKAFSRDIDAVIKHVKEDLKIPSGQIINCGVSLGASLAAETADKMTAIGCPPNQLVICNPFTNMARAASEFANKHINDQKHQTKHIISISPQAIATKLKHPFQTDVHIANLSPTTGVYIFNSGADDFLDPLHGQELAEIAKAKGLKVQHRIEPGLNHNTIPAKEVVEDVMKLYEESQKQPDNSLLGRLLVTRKNIFRTFYPDRVNKSSSAER